MSNKPRLPVLVEQSLLSLGGTLGGQDLQESVGIWTICGLFILAAQLLGSCDCTGLRLGLQPLGPPRLGWVPPRELPGWAGYSWEAQKLA